MKFIIVFVALFALAVAAPPSNADVSVLRQDADVRIDGFNYNLETSDGTKKQEQGELRTIEKEQAITVKGSYSFVADDGQTYTVNYVADENGFQPQGAHLPVAPVA